MTAPDPGTVSETRSRSGRHAALVAAGIFLSRIFGLVRQRVLSKYLGLSEASDAFTSAFRIPNFLQNLLGEGVLSASFIPVYARLRAEGRDHEAEQVAGAVFGMLALVGSVVVLLGMLLADPLTRLIAPGFGAEKLALTIRLVRILFPGAGLFVLSAWCLGVLNSHRRFLLSYAAPVIWNLAIIVTVIVAAGRTDERGIVVAAAAGSVLGSALQFLVQLPTVFTLLRQFRPTLDTTSDHVRLVLRNFTPVFIGRGVVQISGWVDSILASLLGNGPVTALQNAQTIYMLPVSLFGMSISAAELPAMSSATGNDEQIAAALRQRLDAGLRRVAFFVVPSAAAFLLFGGVIAGALYQTGRFTASDTRFVWAILGGSAVGLLAATMGRLYSSGYYALRDTRTPLRYALLRVLLTTALGYLCAVPLPILLGVDPRWGTPGLTGSAGVAGWLEFLLLQRGLNRRIGPTGLPLPYLIRLWSCALLAGGAGMAVWLGVPRLPPIPMAFAVLMPFGLGYLTLSHLLGVPEARGLVGRLGRGR
ncbi:MAG TPA: murein biosynthesis integral membrane protein MurJ [Gemmatimonadales bacterium]|nr:murein biosynthesis integral membrane protein MurJ [Gemmatimonadales bacterium]